MFRHPLRHLLAACAVATTAICVLGVASAAAEPAPVFTPSRYDGPIRGDVTYWRSRSKGGLWYCAPVTAPRL